MNAIELSIPSQDTRISAPPNISVDSKSQENIAKDHSASPSSTTKTGSHFVHLSFSI